MFTKGELPRRCFHHRWRIPLTSQRIALRRIETHGEVERPFRGRQPVGFLVSAVFLEDETATIGAKAANAFSVQPVWPFDISEDWKLITYTIMPVASLPALGSGNWNQEETSGPAVTLCGGAGGRSDPRARQYTFQWIHYTEEAGRLVRVGRGS